MTKQLLLTEFVQLLPLFLIRHFQFIALSYCQGSTLDEAVIEKKTFSIKVLFSEEFAFVEVN